ncbi:MAG: EAL domain-containing protein [Gallionellaceae bacterium]|nr:EAL domain-containing protein [Gallionellaceae bacterium]
MHRLLLRQLQRHLGKDFLPTEQWQAFFQVISAHYEEIDRERTLLENALVVNSQELTEANSHLRVQSEQEHALLRSVIDSIPDLLFFKTPEGAYLGCNRAFEKYIGLPESAIIGKTDFDFLDTALADTLQKTDQQMLALRQPSLSEEWVTYPDHSRVCLEMLRTPYASMNGKLLGLIGIGRDITERKRLEDEMRVATMVYQHSDEGMLVTDANNHIIAINPSCSKITGYSFDEVVGKDPKIFNSGRQDKNFFQEMWLALDTTGYWHGEIWDRRKNGEIYAKRLTINTLYTDAKSVHGYVALFSDITEQKQSEELIWKQANFDTLTGLPNRRMFRDRLEQELKKEHRAGLSLALLLIDLDNFKEINDTLGHHVGDELLVEAARRISTCARESDTVARLGGDEFTIVLPHLVNSSHVERVAWEVITKLSEPFYLGSEVAYLSASIGVTLYPADATEVEQLLKNADQAMYVAKNQGRKCFSYFTQSLQESAQNRLRLLKDLHGALAAKQFKVYFQPIVDLTTGRIRKAEALLRWQHPERGMVGPIEFIPLAEETGLIMEIGDWVFRESALWVKRWIELCPDGFQVSVNTSPVQFREEGNVYVQAWLNHLSRLELAGQSMVIEITEGLLLNADSRVTYKLLKFRDAGVQVAIDDFGTGYSSLSYLKKFDIDYLKIDQSFVRNLATDPNDMALSEAIIVMAHKLGLKVIAEGVETEQQRNLLAQAGCDFGQGYLFAKPMPPEEFEAMLQRDLVVPS